MGEPVHTTQVHSGITEVPLQGTELWTKVQYCVLVTKCSLTEGTMLYGWRGPLDFLNLFFHTFEIRLCLTLTFLTLDVIIFVKYSEIIV